MLTVQTEDLLRRLRTGSSDPADVHFLESIPAREFWAELESAYPFQFQERRLRSKWELSAARSVEFSCPAAVDGNHRVQNMTQVFRRCLFLSSENEKITGVSLATALRVKPIGTPFRGHVLTTGRGFKLDLTIDGWHVKPQARRTVKLTDEFLRNRGWRFDAIQQLFSKS